MRNKKNFYIVSIKYSRFYVYVNASRFRLIYVINTICVKIDISFQINQSDSHSFRDFFPPVNSTSLISVLLLMLSKSALRFEGFFG